MLGKFLVFILLAELFAMTMVWADIHNFNNRRTHRRYLRICPEPPKNIQTASGLFPTQREPLNFTIIRVKRLIYLMAFILLQLLLSTGTAFSIIWVAIRLYVYFVGDILNQGFTAGVGSIIIAGSGFPVTFLAALIIWLDDNRSRSLLVKEVGMWLVALLISLGVSSLITIGLAILVLISIGWKVSFDGDDGGMLFVLGIGFPILTLFLHTAALRKLGRC